MCKNNGHAVLFAFSVATLALFRLAATLGPDFTKMSVFFYLLGTMYSGVILLVNFVVPL